MGKKGKRSKGGEGETVWGAPKTAQFLVQVTQIAKILWKSKLRMLEISAAEFVEIISRSGFELRGSQLIISFYNPNKTTIGSLVWKEIEKRGWDAEQMAKESDLTLEQIDKILNYELVGQHEIIALQTVLTRKDGALWTIEELMSINSVEPKVKKKNGKNQAFQ